MELVKNNTPDPGETFGLQTKKAFEIKVTSHPDETISCHKILDQR